MDTISVINPRAEFPEGPVWYGNKLYYVEYAAHRVSTWDGSRNEVFWHHDGTGPSAVIPAGNGDFWVTCYDSNSIARISARGETIAFYDHDQAGQGFAGPNDFSRDAANGVYFTASGPWEPEPVEGKIFYIAPEGRIKQVADDLHYANGLALTADGRTLFCAESEAHRIVSFTVGADGSLCHRRVFAVVNELDPQSGAGAFPDGIKLDRQGNLYICQYSSGRILVVSPERKLLRVVVVPSPASPNLAFSPDEDHIYVAAIDEVSGPDYLGKVYRITNR